MPSSRDERLKVLRALRERVRRQPEKSASFPGELHKFLMELHEAAARVDENNDGFANALTDLCRRRGVERWEDAVAPNEQRQFLKDGCDPLTQRIIAFWHELDEPLAF